MVYNEPPDGFDGIVQEEEGKRLYTVIQEYQRSSAYQP